jgi:hypothetical protein
MLRNDLLADAPSLTDIGVRVSTSDLYGATSRCDWGDSANFLESTPRGAVHELHLEPQGTLPDGRELSIARVPSSIDLKQVQLAQLVAPRGIGTATVTIGDRRTPGPSGIHLRVLPFSGDRIPVRVGSCLQWHGYDGRYLYVLQGGGTSIDRVLLSAVR